MIYVGVFGLKLTVETRPRWLLTIYDHLVNLCGLRLEKTIKLSYQGLLGLKMTIWTMAYGRESWFSEACWYSIDSPGSNGHFKTKHP